MIGIRKLIDMVSHLGRSGHGRRNGESKRGARQKKDKQADYMMAPKDNQRTLHEGVKLFAAEQIEISFTDCLHDMHRAVYGKHGRIDTFSVHVIGGIDWLEMLNRFGHTPWRFRMLAGLLDTLRLLSAAGCQRAFVDGSFANAEKNRGISPNAGCGGR